MTDIIRIEADGEDGVVHIFTDPETACELANLWEAAHAKAHGGDHSCHPTFLLDAGNVRRAAIAAQLKVIARIVDPVRRALRLVGADQ